jgi:hypothetical protein
MINASTSRFASAVLAGLLSCSAARATNPLITDQFTADPTARVFEGRMYVYPSHDIREPPGYHGRPNWFVMEDYHVFSSDNLTDWKDHGVILSRNDVPWADHDAYAMWAPDAVYKDGKYFFYFPAPAAKEGGGGFRIGVAMADHPYGPFKPLDKPIDGVHGIDPGVLIDKDGSAYLYWSGMDKLWAARLKPNMTEIDGDPQTFDYLPKKGLQEGPFVFERNGTYYLTYPHVIPTLRGVGLVDARSEIQIDRYSATSADGIAVSFLDEANPHAGWKTTFGAPKSWVSFGEVDFGKGGQKKIGVRAKTAGKGVLEIRLDAPDGPLLGRVLAGSTDWGMASGRIKKTPAGIHGVVVTLAEGVPVDVDWISFR